MLTRADITPNFIREHFSYNQETGIVTVKKKFHRSRRVVGTVVGSPNNHGYLLVKIHGFAYSLQRVIWAIKTGDWPSSVIDHINGNRTDNRWCNLRDVTIGINTQNQRSSKKDNQSGFIGVHPYRGRWRASIHYKSKTIKLGVFGTPEEAHAAYLNAKRRLHAGCTI